MHDRNPVATNHEKLPEFAERDSYDAIVVGAGVIGAATARELSRYELSILVLEAGLDLACGATRANSGIVHAGFDPKPGTLKARYNVEGAALFPQWQRELGFGYYKNGALVLAFDEADLAVLDELAERAHANGVEGVSIIGQDELRELEPNVSHDAIAALSAPTSGICDPYGLTYGAAENAAANGVTFLFDQAVIGIVCTDDGFEVRTKSGMAPLAHHESETHVQSGAEFRPQHGATFHARAVVNCAGIHADEINNMVSTRKLQIQPVKGEYLLYHNALAGTFHHTMFQTPGAQGKGVLVSPVIFGNIFIGPNATAADSKDDLTTTAEGMTDVLARAKRTWSGASTERVIATYAGLRARDASGAGDFIVGEAPDVQGFFNAACIDSPGLASAPAIATDLARMAATRLGARERADFEPHRTPAPLPAMMDEASRAELIAANPAYGVPVCECCHVSEGEIVDVLHRALPALTLDAVKWRTGATMGPCHGGRCTSRILRIAQRELGEGALQDLKRFHKSPLVLGAQDPLDDATVEEAANQAREMRERLAAEGLRETGGGELGLAGTRPAGICSALEALDLLAVTKRLPGAEVVVWGTHDDALRTALVLHDAGARICRILESEQELAGSPELLAQVAERDIPIDCGARATRIAGANRLEGISIARAPSCEEIACNLLVASPRLVKE